MNTALPPRWWLPCILTSAGTAVATLASLSGLSAVLAPGRWWSEGVGLVAVLAVVTVAARLTMMRTRLLAGDLLSPPASTLPTFLGLVVGAWGVFATYGGATGRFTPLVSLHSIELVASRFADALDLARGGIAPVDVTRPLAMLVVIGAGIVFLVADLIAGGLHYRAVAGITMVGLWLPVLLIGWQVPDGSFAVTVLALVLMLAADAAGRAPRRARSPLPARMRVVAAGREFLAASTGATVVAAAAVAVGAASSGLPALVHTPWSSLAGSTGGVVRLSTDLDMRRTLTERSEEVVLQYTNDGPDVGPLRVFTLADFDGTSWGQGTGQAIEAIDSPDQSLWPDPQVRTAGTPRTLRITVRSLRDTRLPIPTEPRTVDAVGDWSYDSVRDEVIGTDRTGEGDTYTTTVHPRVLDADLLRQASGPDPDDRRILDVPDSSHADDIRALAQKIAGPEATRYDQALALQTYLRDATRFTYDPTIPPADTDDAVWDFLSQRTGYCVQYATAMTIMARSLGIPTRMAVGFLPGDEVHEGVFEITGKDSHAWPEVYFPDSGWVRFEPTPAQQTGPTPAWAAPVSADLRVEEDRRNGSTPIQTGSAPPTGATSGSADTAGQTSRPTSGHSTWTVAVAVAAAALLAFLTGAWLLRRRTSRPDPVQDAESAWELLRQSLADLGIEWSPSATPRQVPRVVGDQMIDRWGSSGAINTPLTELAQAVQEVRYASRPRPASPVELARWVDEVIAAATLVMNGKVSRPGPDDDPSDLPIG